MPSDLSQTLAYTTAKPPAGARPSIRAGTIIYKVLSAFFLIAILLTYVSLTPQFPQPGLDSAWGYALNEAVARGMVFGRDIIFTFGPWASAYTRQYHPATHHLMLTAEVLVGLALAMGGLSLAGKGRLAYVLPLPAAIALLRLPDSLFLVLPLLFLMVSVRVTLPETHKWKLAANWQVAVSLVLMVLGLSLLPLVKVTFAAMLAPMGALGWLLLLRWRVRWALVLGGIFIGALIGFWVAAGQPLWALPGFFVAQIPIMSGYSDAMSLLGAPMDLILYGISASLLLLASLLFFAHGGGLSGKALCGGLALSLFLVFKAGFVRHDGHALIAAEFILLVSFFFATSLPHIAAVTLIAASVFTWLPTEEHYSGIKTGNLIASLENPRAIRQLWKGLRAWLGLRQDLRQRFDSARAGIQRDNPLPYMDGGADIYPVRQDLLLASGLQWSPRPIIQSYSAYEPKLADINANHLLGTSAPEHVFFDVYPIGRRLASLEDGKSWPLLLTQYRVIDRAGRFLVLGRNPGVSSAPEMQDISTGLYTLGQQVDLPKENEPIWAEVEVKPTLLGQLFNALFKPPQLHILFRHADGHTENFRYIAAMGRSGFIISPVIHNASDFAALLMKGRDQYFLGTRPTSVEIAGDAGSDLCWESKFEVRLRRINIPIQPGVEKSVYDQ
jgi:hypothetical protein